MAKAATVTVKRTPTPTEAVVAAAQAASVATITAPDGRRITIKKLTSVDRMRLAGVVGGDLARNEVYFTYCLLAASVMAIDDEPEGGLNSAKEVEALVGRLEEDALVAIGKGHEEHFGAVDGSLDKDALKN